MYRRWVSLAVLAAGFLALGWGAQRTFAEWRFRAGLKQARADVAARRFEAARRWLASQSIGRPENGEAAFLLGLCEQSLGHAQAASTALEGVPLASRWGIEAALARARTLIDDLGEYSKAEAVLRGAMAVAGRGADLARLRYALSPLLYREGRRDEMRRLFQDGWGTSPDRAGDLLDLWKIDNAPLSFEPIQTVVERAARQAPDDDRVWLARAHLAMQAGRLAEAARWLDACLKRRPEDPVVWRARLRLAQAADRMDEAQETLSHLPANWFSHTEVQALRAWLAARQGRDDEERRALEELIDEIPGHMPALERLAALASKAGQTDRAVECRRCKAEADRNKERYYRILEARGPITRYAELGRLAEKLGRGFEARGWWFLAAQQDPRNSVAEAAVARLGPPRPDPHPVAGQMLATLLADRPSVRSHPHRGSRFAPAPTAVTRPRVLPVFRDDAESAGLRFAFQNGRSPMRQLPETTSGGVGLLDYDGDGWLDVYVVQGGVFPPDPARPSSGDRLFRNRGDGTFEDQTGPSRIGRLSSGYGHGVAVGDVDNDGHPDLFLTRWRSYALYRNRGDGTFEDITEQVGLGGDRDWPTSAAFADLDNDGDLDLYVCSLPRLERRSPHSVPASGPSG